MAYVDGIAELSAVDWRARGLDGLGKPEGFLERQVARWLAQLDRYHTRDLPHLEFLTKWLDSNRPTMSAAGIIHGDCSPFNVMVAPRPPVRLAAIIDWDTGTIEDPLIDLGHLLARWTEPGEEPVITLRAGGVDGYPTRAAMAERYGARTARDLSALPYYEALALSKLAVILEGRHAMEVKMGVAAEHTSMATIVPGRPHPRRRTPHGGARRLRRRNAMHARVVVTAMDAVAAAEFRAWAQPGGKDDPAERIGAALRLIEDGLVNLDD